eukprot:404184_1
MSKKPKWTKYMKAKADPIDMDKEFYKKPPNGDADAVSVRAEDFTFPIYKYKTKSNKFVSACGDNDELNNKIGIVTQCSVDRMDRLKAMSDHWDGIISVSIYIKNLNELFIVQNMFETEFKNKKNIKIHLIFAKTTSEYYPINYLRNIALKNCNCEYVFLLDIDFVVNMNLYDEILNNLPQTKELLVIPAFELVDEYRTQSKYHPVDKKELMSKYMNGQIRQFHISNCCNGHKLTNYTKWIQYDDTNGEQNSCYNINYDINNVNHYWYEPYVVVKNDKYLVKYDERFTGYGMNKIMHIANLAIKQKYTFKVLKNGFVTSAMHARSIDFYTTYKSQKRSPQRLKWLNSLCSVAMHDITTKSC